MVNRRSTCLLSVALCASMISSLAFASIQSQSSEPDAPSEPWGYVWVFRTMRLIPLNTDVVSVGRLAENDIVLTSPRVSRRHASIRLGDNGPVLIDIGSSNGSHLNGEPLRPDVLYPLTPGSRIQIADELLLFHTSETLLWQDELRHRLLGRLIRLREDLPADRVQKSFGREETVPAVTIATVSGQTGDVRYEHVPEWDGSAGFGKDKALFVGGVSAESGQLELSLWAVSGGGGMTGRRASLLRLEHASMQVKLTDPEPLAADGSEGAEGPVPQNERAQEGPLFPSAALVPVFEIFDDQPELSLRFSYSLAMQENEEALRDAVQTLYFRHQMNPDEWNHLVLAAKAQALRVNVVVDEKGVSLTPDEKATWTAALAEARQWLQVASDLGAEQKQTEEVEQVIQDTAGRLSRLP